MVTWWLKEKRVQERPKVPGMLLAAQHDVPELHCRLVDIGTEREERAHTFVLVEADAVSSSPRVEPVQILGENTSRVGDGFGGLEAANVISKQDPFRGKLIQGIIDEDAEQ